MNWIDRDEALARLAVKPQTLYAYVSRGLVAAKPHEDDHRASLYSGPDIQRLVERRKRGRARTAIASAAIAWGDPVMETAITTVRDGKLIYRGKDAVRLARTATLEETAYLLWGVSAQSSETPSSEPKLTSEFTGETGKARALAYLAKRAGADPATHGECVDMLARQGVDLLQGVGAAIVGAPDRGLVHQQMGRHWGLTPDGMDLLRRALVLVADHELNPSTFAARIAASTGAPLAAAALSGLSALTGPLHGEASTRALGYLRLAAQEGYEVALSDLATRRENLPGLGHTLYPQGDVRAAALLRWMKPRPAIADGIRAAEQVTGQPPNVDMALAALTLHLGLPEDAPFLIFAAGRMAGWIAHAIEQTTSGRLIRPRATYQGR